MEINKNDYIEGHEVFGGEIRRITGWVNDVKVSEFGTVCQIQADDSYEGTRGTVVHTSYGEIRKLGERPRPSFLA